MAEDFANLYTTTLADVGGIASGATSLTLTSATGAPTAPFRLKIDNELILVGGRTGTSCSSLTRGLEGTTAAAHAQGATIRHVVTAGALVAMRAERGAFADRPATSAEKDGRIYLPSDGVGMSRDRGSQWDPFGPLFPFSPPPNSGWSWVNQGSSTIATEKDSELLTGAGTGTGANLVLRVRTAPTPPYVITAALLVTMINKPFNSYGLCFRDSSGGGIHLFDQLGAVSSAPIRIRSTKFTNATTFSADYSLGSAVMSLPQQILWMRIADDNTNRICSVSADGQAWLQLHSIGRTDFITANQVGFGIGTENTNTPNTAPIVRVLSWLES